jgi:non-heme chloroperoxidase
MGTITVGHENGDSIVLYYEDHGSGDPVVLLAGWPFDSRAWERHIHELLELGYRVVAYDRRGFGRSSRPAEGYEFDTLADDLHTVMSDRDVRDATIVGHSLGTGELARYAGRYGTERLKACVFIETLAPSFVKSDANPDGADQATIDTIRQAIVDDRGAWLSGLLRDFLNLDEYLGNRVSEETVRDFWNAGMAASLHATRACVLTWLDDFTADLARLDVPTLILHGTADRILSLEGQGHRLRDALPDARYMEIEGGPHLTPVSHAADVTRELSAFLGHPASMSAAV